MAWRTNRIALAAISLVTGLGLSGCATTDYVDEQIATVNQRISSVESQVAAVDAAAKQGNAAALQAAQEASSSATRAHQRIDELDALINALRTPKRPRN